MSKSSGGTLMPAGFPNVAITQQTGTPSAPGAVLSTSNPLAPITTNTTTTPLLATFRLRQLFINVQGAPAAWQVIIRDKGGTPFVVFQQTFAAPLATPIILSFGDGIKMIGGLDIITSGTTPGTLYVALNY